MARIAKMLYVFHVDTGTMLTFDMNVAMQNVVQLHEAIKSRCNIPPDKQVLLISGGENLDPASRVCSYSAGTVYQAKPSKTVVAMLTLHGVAECQTDGKKKPESVLFYNENKCCVDVLDAMCKLMSTKVGCRRWPLAVCFNVLDMAAVNSWILFQKVIGSKMSR